MKSISYNPFFDKFNANNCKTNSSVTLFLDKLKNINGYELRVGFFKSCWPKCNASQFGISGAKMLNNLYNEHMYFSESINAKTNYLMQSQNFLKQESFMKQNLNLMLGNITLYYI